MQISLQIHFLMVILSFVIISAIFIIISIIIAGSIMSM